MQFKARSIPIEFIVIGVIAFVLALITFPNHYFFRTHALDLGMFNQALYALSTGNSPVFTQGLDGKLVPYFGDHFSVLLILFVPFQWIFGSYALLIVQWITAIFSFYFLRKLCLHFEFKDLVRYAILLLYGFSYGLIAAFGYDFHMNVIAALLLVPLWYAFIARRNTLFFILLSAILFSKENTSLWMIFVALVLFIEYFKDRERRVIALLTALISLSYFLCVVLWWMPAINEGQIAKTISDHYSIGSQVTSSGDFLLQMVKSPDIVFHKLTNTVVDGQRHSKFTSLFFFLMGGGILLLFKPHFLLLAFPIFFQKYMSDNVLMWDVKYHYSAEFAPILVMGTIYFLVRFRQSKWSIYLVSFITVLSTYYSVREIIRKDVRTNVFASQHYKSEIDRSDFKEIQELVENDASIACSSNLAPHLSNRKKVFILPQFIDAESVVVNIKVDSLLTTDSLFLKEYHRVFQTTELSVYRKN